MLLTEEVDEKKSYLYDPAFCRGNVLNDPRFSIATLQRLELHALALDGFGIINSLSDVDGFFVDFVDSTVSQYNCSG